MRKLMSLVVVVLFVAGTASATVYTLQNPDEFSYGSPLKVWQTYVSWAVIPNNTWYGVEYLSMGQIILADLSSIPALGPNEYVASATFETYNRPDETFGHKPAPPFNAIPFNLSVGAIAESYVAPDVYEPFRDLYHYRTSPYIDPWSGATPWKEMWGRREVMIDPPVAEWNAADVTAIVPA